MSNFKSLIFSLLMIVSYLATGQNPIIRNQFSADPTARVFNVSKKITFIGF